MNSYPALAKENFAPDPPIAWLPTPRMVAAFAAGALTPFTVELMGLFPIGEVVLAATLGYIVLYLALQHRWPEGLLRSPVLWVFMACQAIAFVGYVLADLYWNSSGNDMARGWARMVFLAIDIVSIVFLFYGPRQHQISGFLSFEVGYAVGMSCVAAFGYVLFEDYWKFGWATPVTIAVLLLAPRLGFWVTQAACTGLGVLHYVLDFRSLAGICLLVPVALMVQWLPKGTRVAALLVVAVLGVGTVTFRDFNSHKTRSSSETARAGRSDIERSAMLEAAWNGFKRSPWLGNGSWFSKSNVMEDFFAIRYENSWLDGIGSYEEEQAVSVIALHSQILVALAEGGILGGCFFVFYGIMLLWALWYCVIVQPWHYCSAFYVYFLLLKVWDLGMSPFSGAHRVLIAVAVGLILVLWHESAARKAKPALPAQEFEPFELAHAR